MEEEEEDDVEENDIEEDDFEEDTDFSSGTKIPFSINRENVNISLDKVTKFHISPISTTFIFFLTDSGSPPRKFGWYGSKKNIESRHS